MLDSDASESPPSGQSQVGDVADIADVRRWASSRFHQSKNHLDTLQTLSPAGGERGYINPEEGKKAVGMLDSVLRLLLDTPDLMHRLKAEQKLASPAFWAIALCQAVMAARPEGYEVSSKRAQSYWDMDAMLVQLDTKNSTAFYTAENGESATRGGEAAARRLQGDGKRRVAAVHELGDATARQTKMKALSMLLQLAGHPPLPALIQEGELPPVRPPPKICPAAARRAATAARFGQRRSGAGSGAVAPRPATAIAIAKQRSVLTIIPTKVRVQAQRDANRRAEERRRAEAAKAAAEKAAERAERDKRIAAERAAQKASEEAAAEAAAEAATEAAEDRAMHRALQLEWRAEEQEEARQAKRKRAEAERAVHREVEVKRRNDRQRSNLSCTLDEGGGSSGAGPGPSGTNRCVLRFTNWIAPIRVSGMAMRKAEQREAREAEREAEMNEPIHIKLPAKRKPGRAPAANLAAAAAAPLDISLRETTRMRSYQLEAVASVRGESGIINLACGAGKSLVGIAAIAERRTSCLILCTTCTAVEQFVDELLKWTTVSPARIKILTSSQKDRCRDIRTNEPLPCVMVATYAILTAGEAERSTETKFCLTDIAKRKWGLLLLDEVHAAAAEETAACLAGISRDATVGLSATLLRADGKIDDLEDSVGPIRYSLEWKRLEQLGHLAEVSAVQVPCPLPSKWIPLHDTTLSERVKKSIVLLNPRKMQACAAIVAMHRRLGNQVLIFCDSLPLLHKTAEKLGGASIDGDTPDAARRAAIGRFKKREIDLLLLSRVGDTSIDLPDASVGIQIDSLLGSERQEAQRLGRLMRPKTGGGSAVFYDLFSELPRQEEHLAHRTAFLENRGYKFVKKTAAQICGEGGSLPPLDPDEAEALFREAKSAEELSARRAAIRAEKAKRASAKQAVKAAHAAELESANPVFIDRIKKRHAEELKKLS